MKKVTMNAATVSTNGWHYTRQDIEKLVAEALQKAADAHDDYDCRDYLDHIDYEQDDPGDDDAYCWLIHVYTKDRATLAGLIATNIARIDTDCWDWFVSSIYTAEVEVDDDESSDNSSEQEETRKIIEQAQEELAEVIEMLHNCKSLDDVCEIVRNTPLMGFGSCSNPSDGQIDIDYGIILTSVWMQDNVLAVNPNVHIVVGNHDFTQYLSEISTEGVASQDCDSIYLKPDKSEPTPKKPDNSYGKREFTEHARDIFNDGHAIFHTDVNGKRYIINGLFDSDDLIVHIYDEDSMTLLKRIFWIGVQDGVDAESEYLADYFEETFVDTWWNDSWYMTDKQFDFLKNA